MRKPSGGEMQMVAISRGALVGGLALIMFDERARDWAQDSWKKCGGDDPQIRRRGVLPCIGEHRMYIDSKCRQGQCGVERQMTTKRKSGDGVVSLEEKRRSEG